MLGASQTVSRTGDAAGSDRPGRHLGQLPQCLDLNGDGAGQSQDIGDHLGDLDTGQPQEVRQNPYQRDKEDALPGHGQEGAGDGTGNGLAHHVG